MAGDPAREQKTVCGELAERIALALDLQPDWFPETRQTRLFERVRADIASCDRLYDEYVAPPPLPTE